MPIYPQVPYALPLGSVYQLLSIVQKFIY
jgi:hypothetical protein